MSDDKTEQPTAKKLRDARQKGQIAKSQEVTSTAVVLAVFAYIWGGWSFILNGTKEMLQAPATFMNQPFKLALGNIMGAVGANFVLLSLPLLMLVIVASIVGNMIQVGVLFSFDSVKPDLNRMNPQQWFKKVFAKKNLLEFGKSLFKILFLMILMHNIIKDALQGLLRAPQYGLDALLALQGDLLRTFVLYCGGTYVAISALDYLLQHKMHIKELMMSKDEVKREYKEMEGDPHIKSKRKHLHQEMIMNDSMDKVRKASVLVTNPTHLAIAIFYDAEQTDLPVITAKGQDHIAQRMIEVAKEAGVPIMRNVPLARDLWEQGELMEYIPSELIEPIAEVLKWVSDITGRH